MKLLLSPKQEIIAFARVGDLPESIEFNGLVPDEFDTNFKPSFFMMQNNEIVVNPNYEEPTVVDPGPSEAQQQLAQVTYQQMMTKQDVTTLQTQNAQMAYQLMMQQQGGEA